MHLTEYKLVLLTAMFENVFELNTISHDQTAYVEYVSVDQKKEPEPKLVNAPQDSYRPEGSAENPYSSVP